MAPIDYGTRTDGNGSDLTGQSRQDSTPDFRHHDINNMSSIELETAFYTLVQRQTAIEHAAWEELTGSMPIERGPGYESREYDGDESLREATIITATSPNSSPITDPSSTMTSECASASDPLFPIHHVNPRTNYTYVQIPSSPFSQSTSTSPPSPHNGSNHNINSKNPNSPPSTPPKRPQTPHTWHLFAPPPRETTITSTATARTQLQMASCTLDSLVDHISFLRSTLRDLKIQVAGLEARVQTVEDFFRDGKTGNEKLRRVGRMLIIRNSELRGIRDLLWKTLKDAKVEMEVKAEEAERE